MNYEQRDFIEVGEVDFFAENEYKTIVDFRKISQKGVPADKVIRGLKKYLKTFNKK